MDIHAFETEHFFARYEFITPHQLCNSDCESISIAELLSLAGDSLEAFGKERLIYTESQGSPRLREAIAGNHEMAGPDDVVVLGTPVEGIYLAARALLNPGDEVIVLSPAYDALINLFEHVAGAGRVHRWTLRPEASGWRLDLAELKRMITPATRLLVVNFPHNPTGYQASAEFQRDLVKTAAGNGLWLFCDEMYYGLFHSGTPAIPSAIDVYEQAIVLSGLSKTHGLPGLRCGWLVVRDRNLRESLVNWKFYTSICPPVATEYLALAALRAQAELTRRNIERIERNLEHAGAFFRRWPETFTWRPPHAGTTALVEYHVPSVSEVAGRLAAEEGVLIQPAGMLGSDDGHMRIGLGRENFPEALDRFEDWLHREA